jgi:hypothetical protein
MLIVRWLVRVGAAHARKVDDASSGQFIPAQGVVEQEMHVTDDMGLARIA